MIVATNLIPSGFDAITIWPFIFVRLKHKDNKGLITHEKVHLEGQRKAWVIPWWIKYAFNPKFRLEAEVRGYKAQIAAEGISVESAARYMTQYGVQDLTYEEAITLLTT